MAKRTRRPVRQPRRIKVYAVAPDEGPFPVRRQKLLWASLLLLSTGGTIALAIIAVVVGPPPWLWFAWPPVAACSSWQLKRCYLREPSMLPGFWHLRLEDLIFAGIYAGLWLAILKPLLGLNFPITGIFFSLGSALALVIGCLAAQRHGYTRPMPKLLFAWAYATRLIGLIALGTLLAAIVMDGLVAGMWFEWTKVVLFHSDRYVPPSAPPWILLHRMSLASLPIGMLLMWVVRRGVRKVQIPPLDAPVSATMR